MSLSKTLEELIKANGEITISDLSKLTKVPQPTLHHIISGYTKKPARKSLEAIANFFSITVNQLKGNESIDFKKVKNHPQNKIKHIPLLEWNELKNISKINLVDHHGKKIISEIDVSDKSFALVSSGSKLEQLFPDGCILIIDQLRQPKNRDFVIVYIEENQEYLLRRIFIEGNVQYVRSPESVVNDASLHKINQNTDKIIGTLVESKIRF